MVVCVREFQASMNHTARPCPTRGKKNIFSDKNKKAREREIN